jgi:hypothetical protein
VFSKAHDQVRVVRRNVWKIAQAEVLVRNGLPLMTEDKASKVLDPKLCPKTKVVDSHAESGRAGVSEV